MAWIGVRVKTNGNQWRKVGAGSNAKALAPEELKDKRLLSEPAPAGEESQDRINSTDNNGGKVSRSA